MVNRGASQGCITCRQRHVKCDESKPQCKRCLRLVRECVGYGKKGLLVRFKNESGRLSGRPSDQRRRVSNRSLAKPTAATMTMTTKAMTKATTTPTQLTPSASHDYTVILSSPPLVQQDLALSFFLTYVTGVGRNLESTRGFMEFVRPVLAAERHNSTLFAAVNAVAALLRLLLGHSSVSISRPTHLLNSSFAATSEGNQGPGGTRTRRDGARSLSALAYHEYISLRHRTVCRSAKFAGNPDFRAWAKELDFRAVSPIGLLITTDSRRVFA